MKQIDRVRAHLRAGRKLSSWEAIQEWRITRLAAIIHNLKKEGMLIKKETRRNPDTGKRYAVYYTYEPIMNKSQYSLFRR